MLPGPCVLVYGLHRNPAQFGFHFQVHKMKLIALVVQQVFVSHLFIQLHVQGGPKKLHSVYGNNFVYSQSFFIIFGTCTL